MLVVPPLTASLFWEVTLSSWVSFAFLGWTVPLLVGTHGSSPLFFLSNVGVVCRPCMASACISEFGVSSPVLWQKFVPSLLLLCSYNCWWYPFLVFVVFIRVTPIRHINCCNCLVKCVRLWTLVVNIPIPLTLSNFFLWWITPLLTISLGHQSELCSSKVPCPTSVVSLKPFVILPVSFPQFPIRDFSVKLSWYKYSVSKPIPLF